MKLAGRIYRVGWVVNFTRLISTHVDRKSHSMVDVIHRYCGPHVPTNQHKYRYNIDGETENSERIDRRQRYMRLKYQSFIFRRLWLCQSKKSLWSWYKSHATKTSSNIFSDSPRVSSFREVAFNFNSLQDEGLPWDEHQQNLILGGFFWFGWSAQFFGGILAHKFGSKLTFGFSTFIACALSAAIPKLAYFDSTGVLTVRVLQGFIGVGWIFPKMSLPGVENYLMIIFQCLGIPAGLFEIIGQWSPPDERGKFMSVFLGKCQNRREVIC